MIPSREGRAIFKGGRIVLYRPPACQSEAVAAGLTLPALSGAATGGIIVAG